jgi:chromosome segregation ATPase/SAM-dependent methyltransferase
VLEVGAVASTGGRSARFLIERGARSVLACDSDLAAVEAAQKSVGGPDLHFRANVFDDLGTASFDLALIADLNEYARSPQLVREIRRLLADTGFLLGGLRNPAGLALSQLVEPDALDAPATYGQLLDALGPHFACIQAGTQSPVLGYQVSLEHGESLQVDGTLASAGEAAYFVVVAGQEPCRIFEPTWVQLPPEPLAYMGSRVGDYSRRSHELTERSNRLKAALEKARDDLSAREAELSRVGSQLAEARQDSARLWAEVQEIKSSGPGIAERDDLAARVRRLESEVAAASERVAQADAQAARQREQLESAHRSKMDLESRLTGAQEAACLERARREEVAKLFEDSGARLAKAREELRSAQDDAAAIRLELQRARAAQGESQEALNALRVDLEMARERELRLADEVSRLSAADEQMRTQLAQSKASGDSAQAQLALARGELEAALRASAADSEALRQAREAVEQERQRAQVAVQSSAREAAEAELATALAEVGRLSRELEAAAAAQRDLKQLSVELENKLAEARDLSGVQQLKLELKEERARSERLENDVSAAVAAERSNRERLELALAEAQAHGSQLQAQVEQADDRAAAAALALETVRIDAKLAAELAAERERRGIELSGRLRELEARLNESTRQLKEGEREKGELAQKLEAATAETTSLRDRFQTREEELIAGRQQISASLGSAEAEIGRLRGELAAERAGADESSEQVRVAQAAAAGLAEELEGLRDRLESATAETRMLEEDRLRLSTGLEHLEAERAWMAERLEGAEAERDTQRQLAERLESAEAERDSLRQLAERLEGAEAERDSLRQLAERLESAEEERDSLRQLAERLESAEAERDSLRHFADGARDREAELSTALADRENKLEILQRRLAAQDSELAALRRSLTRTPSAQVQQIYERATAELSAVKAELFRRPAEPPREAVKTPELEPKKR